MTAVARLVAHVALDEQATDASHLSVSARLEAVLTDGRTVVLLDDRGWSCSGPADLRDRLSPTDIENDALTVVGPDEPSDGTTHDQMAAAHWTHLADILRRDDIDVDADVLRRLPVEVALSQSLRAWVA
ncbi:hypothetical protein ACWEOO_30500 [Kribbella sp. NPDC004138]